MHTTPSRNSWLFALLAALLLVASVGCGDESEPNPSDPSSTTPGTTSPQPDNEVGASDFVSADGANGQDTSRSDEFGNDASADGEAGGGGGEERTAEEGDIYRVLGQGRILNLNAFRGLQIIDSSNPDSPEVIGRVQVSGHPVELYVVGDRAYILLNNWYGYYGSRNDIDVDDYYGGLVVVADISDPTQPRITGQARVPGWIQTSRLTRGGGDESLYVVGNNYGNEGSTTIVRSFSVSEEGALLERSTLDLGGYVMDIQATGSHLMVARYDWNNNGQDRTLLSLVDISDPSGVMHEGAQIRTAGIIQNKHNMNIYNGVLRVASGAWWNNTNTNHVETWNIADIDNPVRIDHETYGDGERLFATLFLGNKAFFVTYLQVDPFHAFEITDDGEIEEKAEYIISGWNNFFRPVEDETRLIGIGVDDQAENGRTMAVSLYDITDLANPEPFVDREDAASSGWAWSEAQWDDRAFSVLEDVVHTEDENGNLETGMVLLPFSGWDPENERYLAAVQIFTFGADSVTARGVMHHGTQVRRSFPANPETNLTANLSEAELSLFDTNNPEEPQERGRVELAPNYADFFLVGEGNTHGARLKYRADYYYGWWDPSQADLPETTIEVVSLDEHPDTAEPLATVTIPANAQVQQVGTHLVSFQTEYLGQRADEGPEYETYVKVIDFANPTSPRVVSSFTTTELNPYGGYYGYGYEDCWDCGGYGYGWGYYVNHNVHTTDNAVVFANTTQQRELLGLENVCNSYSDYNTRDCWNRETGDYQECTYVSGYRSCRSLNGEPEVCQGDFQMCTQDSEGRTTCEPYEPNANEIRTECYENDRYRYWWNYSFQALDLTNPAAPALQPAISMPTEEEDISMLSEGSKLHVTHRTPVEVDGDPRGYVRYFFKTIDFSTPSSPSVSDSINIPGQLVAIDGNRAITRDFHWGENIVDASVNVLTIDGDRAILKGTHRMRDQQVHNIILDGAGHALISHRLAWQIAQRDPNFDWDNNPQKLTILDVEADDLDVLAVEDIDQWANLQSAERGRAIFSVPGGILVFNVSDAANPTVQSFFPIRGWSYNLKTLGDNLYFPAGRYGLYEFNIHSSNILLR